MTLPLWTSLVLAVVSPAIASIVPIISRDAPQGVARREITDLIWEGDACRGDGSIHDVEPKGDTQIGMSFRDLNVMVFGEPPPYRVFSSCSLSFRLPKGYNITTLETRLDLTNYMLTPTVTGKRTFKVYLDDVLKGTLISEHSYYINRSVRYWNEDVQVDASETDGAMYKLKMEIEVEREDRWDQGFLGVNDLEIELK